MKPKQLINEKLFEQFEADGKEVVYTERRGRKIRARVVDPIKKLFEKGEISYGESSSADKYSMDVELSICENYAQTIINGLPASTNELSFEDRRSQASIRVNDVKMLIAHLNTHRQRKLRKILIGHKKSTLYEMILCLIFENRCGIVKVERAIGINHERIYDKCKEIAKVIHNYYEN